MNKKMITIVSIFFLSFFMISYVEASNMEYRSGDTNYQLLMEDDAMLLSEDELEKLASEMEPLTQYGNIAFKTINTNFLSTREYAKNYYHDHFGYESGSVFLIDMAHRMIYIFSDGRNYNIITNNKAEIITDNIYQYATAQHYYECASEAYHQMYLLMQGEKINEPMRYISSGFVAIVSAFLINFIIVLMNSKMKGPKIEEIIKNCNIKFLINDVTVQPIGEHRVYSPQSSSGGSSGGGGGGGGGGSSGGGGGHSF